MMMPIVSVRLHHIRDPSDVPQLHVPVYGSSTASSGSSSMNEVLAVDTMVECDTLETLANQLATLQARYQTLAAVAPAKPG